MSARADLEAAQVEVKSLKASLAAWPAQSPERLALVQQLHQLEAAIASLEASQVDVLTRERLARTALDDATASLGPRGRWYRSLAAPVVVVIALVAAIRLAVLSLDHLNWTYWGPKVALWLLAVPVVVNGLRLLRNTLRPR